MEISCNTTKLAQHSGNTPQHDGNKSQHNEISPMLNNSGSEQTLLFLEELFPLKQNEMIISFNKVSSDDMAFLPLINCMFGFRIQCCHFTF